jgi:hypothetical protein
MHFVDKEAVLAAIAEEGFRLLTESVETVIAQFSMGSTRQKIIAASTEYVKFAINNPNHVQVMFYPYDLSKYPGLLEISQTSLNHLFELVKTGQDNGEIAPGSTHNMTKAI